MNFIFSATPAACEAMGWSSPQIPVESDNLIGRKSLLSDRFHQNWQIDIFDATSTGLSHIIIMEQQSNYTFLLTLDINQEGISDYMTFCRQLYVQWATQHISFLSSTLDLENKENEARIEMTAQILQSAPDQFIGPHAVKISSYENSDPVLCETISTIKHSLARIYETTVDVDSINEQLNNLIDEWNMTHTQLAQLGQSSITGDFNAFALMSADAMYRVLDILNLPDHAHQAHMDSYEENLKKGIEMGKQLLEEEGIELPQTTDKIHFH